MPEQSGEQVRSGNNFPVFMPDLRSRLTVYFLFGGLSLAGTLLGLWTLIHPAARHSSHVQPVLFLSLSAVVLLLGIHGLSVRVAVSESDIKYRSIFGVKRFRVADIVSILPVSARGFAGIKISTADRGVVIHGGSVRISVCEAVTGSPALGI